MVKNPSGFYRYWGKAEKDSLDWHPLVYHCLDVAAVLKVYLGTDPLLRERIARVHDGPFEDIEPWLLYFAALHDVGKFSLPFQNKREDIARLLGVPSFPYLCGTHHTEHRIGLFNTFILDVLEDMDEPVLDEDDSYVLAPLMAAAFGHHGRPVEEVSDIEKGHFSGAQEDAYSYCLAVGELFQPERSLLPDADDSLCSLSWLFAGCMVLADWIGSNTKWFPPTQGETLLQQYYDDVALPRAQIAVLECGILAPESADDTAFHALFEHLKEFSPSALQHYGLQEAVRETGPQLHIFEDLTGGGKTEAAVGCCAKLMENGSSSGIYIGLPTTATANAMYKRMAATYRSLFKATDNPSLMLAHGANRINDDFLPSIGLESSRDVDVDLGTNKRLAYCSAWLGDNRKKALLAPCGVGTLDQALLAVLPVRHQCLRLLGCSQGTIVADEIHSYDSYTTMLLCGLLGFHAGLGGSAVLLSATLTHELRKKLLSAFCKGAGLQAPELECEAFPLATSMDAQGLRETPIPTTRVITADVTLTQDSTTIYERLLDVREKGGCGLWVRNTVDQAREAYEELLAKGVPEGDILLFHARFTQYDRQRIEGQALEWLGKDSTPEQRKGKIIISTQVCESSLDIDSDVICSDLAPMDSLLQRLGRCHRHVREGRPIGYEAPHLFLLSPDPTDDAPRGWYKALLGNAAYVYQCSAVLWRTARLLKDAGKIDLTPDENGNVAEVRRLMEGAHGELDAPQTMLDDEQEYTGNEMGAGALAESNLLEFGKGYNQGNDWDDDTVTPTRNGEESVQLRLLKVTDEGLELWAGPDRSAKTCALSEVRVMKKSIDKLGKPVLTGERAEQLEAFKESLPDKGKWCKILPVMRNGDIWECEMENGAVEYSEVRGFGMSR